MGLDIQKDAVRAVVVKGGLKPAVTAHACAAVNGEGGVKSAVARVLETIESQTGLERVPCAVSFGYDQVFFKNLTIPFFEPKKLRQVLAFELEANLPLRVEDVVADYHIIKKAEHTDCIAAVMAASTVESALEFMSSRGLFAEVLAPTGIHTALAFLSWSRAGQNNVFLDVGPDRAVIALFFGKRILLVRNMGQNFINRHKDLAGQINLTMAAYRETTGRDFAPNSLFVTGSGVLWPELEQTLVKETRMQVTRLDLAKDIGLGMDGRLAGNWEPLMTDGALALAMFQPGETSGFNLRQGAFAVRRRWEEYRRPVIHAAIFAVVLLTAFCMRFYTDALVLDTRAQRLENQVNAVFARVLPKENPNGKPVDRLLAEIEKLNKIQALPDTEGSKVLVIDMLREISRGIGASIDVKIAKFSASRDGVQLNGKTNTYESVDNIKAGLEKTPFFQKVIIDNAAESAVDNMIKFRIKAQI